MNHADWWKEYFNEDYADLILDTITPEFTKIQVELLIETLSLKPNDQILDICCGKGRHSLELAKRGFTLTALDFVPSYTEEIHEKANRENLLLQTYTMDVRNISFDHLFDKAYLMFTSFGYFSDYENNQLLVSIQSSLKKGGLLLIDIENRDYILKNFIYEKWREKDFGLLLERHKFFPETSRQTTRRIQYYKDFTQKESLRDLRLYSLHELLTNTCNAGFNTVKILGDYNGKPFQINSPRIIALLEA
jgi:cyclopropane fatty-acyl-phospholipid synthase-like methyltransferase